MYKTKSIIEIVDSIINICMIQAYYVCYMQSTIYSVGTIPIKTYPNQMQRWLTVLELAPEFTQFCKNRNLYNVI